MISCDGHEKTVTSVLGSLDLSPNDNCIVFSYSQDDNYSLYVGKIDGDSVVNILSSNNDTSYVRPKFSPSGEHILFIAFPKDKKSSNIFVVDKYGKNRRKITSQNQIITDAIFSNNGKTIYYVKSNTYESYSPIGIAAPHDADIYKIDFAGWDERKITNLRAYGIYNPSEVLEKYLLARLEDSSKMGIYLIELSKQHRMRSVIPVNNPRGGADLYYDPYYSESFNIIAFTAPYELYIMDLDSLNAKMVYGPKDQEIAHIHNVLVFKTLNKILFKKETENDAFRTINFDGSNLQKVKIKIP